LKQAITVNPDNLEARYQLSAVQLVANDYDVMQQLLEIDRRDCSFRHDAGRAGLHDVFESGLPVSLRRRNVRGAGRVRTAGIVCRFSGQRHDDPATRSRPPAGHYWPRVHRKSKFGWWRASERRAG
jgi:hypothetical protein